MPEIGSSRSDRANVFVRVHALDAEFLWIEDERSPMHIGSICIFEGSAPPPQDCEVLVAARLALAPVYRMRPQFLPLGIGRPVWVEDSEFDLRNHLQRVILPAPQDDSALYGWMGQVMSELLDRCRPLWRLFVVEGLSGGRWALVTKVHHALVDGVAGIGLLGALIDRQRDAPPQRPTPWAAQPNPTARVLTDDALHNLKEDASDWGRALWGAAKQPRQALRHSAAIATGLLRYARRLAPTRLFSLQGPISGRRGYACARAKLDDVRTIRRAFNCTVNDVVLAALSGGYRALLQVRGDSLRRVHLRSLVPVSARAPDAWGVLGNRVTALLCELPVNPADPLQRLQLIAADMQRSKRSHMAQAGVWLTDLADLAPPMFVSAVSRLIMGAMHDHPQRSIATVITNVPGPSKPLYVLGRRMLEWLPYVPITQGARLGSAVLSYAGQLSFGITADLDHVQDLRVFTRAVEADLQMLLARARATQAQPEIES